MTTFVFAIATTFMLLHALERVGQSCRSIATALWGNSGRKALSRAIASIRGTADSVVMIGIAEGAILGIVFASVGVPHAGSLAIVAALAAAVPFGTATLGLVAAATEMAQGQPAMAAIVMALAISLVVIADYVVRPRLASGGEKMPLTLLLMSIIGGIAAFGLVGLFAGPAATCAAVGAWRSWTAEQAV
jgi:predicted PurR-regulated permease PerM